MPHGTSDDEDAVAIVVKQSSLKTPECARFLKMLQGTRPIARAIANITADLTEILDADIIAKTLGMSRAAFYRRFKEVTGTSPIQYQKRLRLLEARRLMLPRGDTADRAFLNVGFNTSSQFSREFSRMFGRSPKEEVSLARGIAR